MNLTELQAYAVKLERENVRMKYALVNIEAELSDRAGGEDTGSNEVSWIDSLLNDAVRGLGRDQ